MSIPWGSHAQQRERIAGTKCAHLQRYIPYMYIKLLISDIMMILFLLILLTSVFLIYQVFVFDINLRMKISPLGGAHLVYLIYHYDIDNLRMKISPLGGAHLGCWRQQPA